MEKLQELRAQQLAAHAQAVAQMGGAGRGGAAPWGAGWGPGQPGGWGPQQQGAAAGIMPHQPMFDFGPAAMQQQHQGECGSFSELTSPERAGGGGESEDLRGAHSVDWWTSPPNLYWLRWYWFAHVSPCICVRVTRCRSFVQVTPPPTHTHTHTHRNVKLGHCSGRTSPLR